MIKIFKDFFIYDKYEYLFITTFDLPSDHKSLIRCFCLLLSFAIGDSWLQLILGTLNFRVRRFWTWAACTGSISFSTKNLSFSFSSEISFFFLISSLFFALSTANSATSFSSGPSKDLYHCLICSLTKLFYFWISMDILENGNYFLFEFKLRFFHHSIHRFYC